MPAQPEPELAPDAAPSADEIDNTSDEDEKLPEGWSKETSDDGESYYFNEDTGETSWDRPSPPAEDTGAADANNIPAHEAEYESAPTSDGWEAVKETPAEESAVDETESLRAMSTKRDTGSSPAPSVSELDGMLDETVPVAADQNENESSGSNGEDAISGEPVSASSLEGDLPPGWLECKDPSGSSYYVNDLTGESSWERPSGATTDDAPETDSALDESETESLRAMSTKRDIGSSPAPSVSDLDAMVGDAPVVDELEYLAENKLAVETVNQDQAAPEEPRAEESALPEPWVELMTENGEPYVCVRICIMCMSCACILCPFLARNS